MKNNLIIILLISSIMTCLNCCISNNFIKNIDSNEQKTITIFELDSNNGEYGRLFLFSLNNIFDNPLAISKWELINNGKINIIFYEYPNMTIQWSNYGKYYLAIQIGDENNIKEYFGTINEINILNSENTIIIFNKEIWFNFKETSYFINDYVFTSPNKR